MFVHRARTQDGADEYVGKPYEKGYLLSCANEMVRAASRTGDTVRQPPSLLVIDPSESFRQWLKQLVESNGYGLAEAESGAEGLQLTVEIQPRSWLTHRWPELTV